MKAVYRIDQANLIGRVILTFCLWGVAILGQNRGNDLSFQAWDNLRSASALTLSLGNAYTALSGRNEALLFNPAGLAGIDKVTISISGNNLHYQWTENQNYYPNRLFYTLPFYLERLYIPDPKNNGVHDYDIFYNGLPDTAYQVALPDTGLEPYSEAAADWLKKRNATALANITLVYPLKIMGKKSAIALALDNDNNLLDYDRNDTYLDPHIGYIEYNMPRIVNGLDTVRMNWDTFIRDRLGKCQTLRFGLGLQVTDFLKAGFGMGYSWGATRDRQVLNRVGYFLLFNQNDFAFSYDTLVNKVDGNTEYSAWQWNLGLQVAYPTFGAGLNLRMPYRLIKESHYHQRFISPRDTTITTIERREYLDLPISYVFGVYLRPTPEFTLSLDYTINPYSKAKAKVASGVLFRPWVDQKILSWGIEFRPTNWLAVRGGYQEIPEVFVPDGAAFRDQGPRSTCWSAGIGLDWKTGGVIDLAWQLRTLKYYDQYFSNVNYSKIVQNRIMLNYTYSF